MTMVRLCAAENSNNQSLRVSVKAHRSETCIRSHYDEYIIISSSTSSGCVFMSEDYMGRY